MQKDDSDRSTIVELGSLSLIKHSFSHNIITHMIMWVQDLFVFKTPSDCLELLCGYNWKKNNGLSYRDRDRIYSFYCNPNCKKQSGNTDWYSVEIRYIENDGNGDNKKILTIQNL